MKFVISAGLTFGSIYASISQVEINRVEQPLCVNFIR